MICAHPSGVNVENHCPLVMGILVGNGHVESIQIVDETICISHSASTLGKDVHPTLFHPATINSRENWAL